MIPSKEFVETRDGVHLVTFCEYTLCGDALEGDDSLDLEATRSTDKRVVTCQKCIAMLELCRGVRFKRQEHAR